MSIHRNRYNDEQNPRAAVTAGGMTDTDWTGADMRTVPGESPVARLEAERDAALAAFAHLAPRMMQAAEADNLDSCNYLLALQRGMDWLADAGLSFADARAARLRVACPDDDPSEVAA
jgi:hypothetical protein